MYLPDLQGPAKKSIQAMLAILCASLALSASAEPLKFSEPVALSDADRRIDAMEIALGPDGTVHIIWVDKGAAAGASLSDDRAGHREHTGEGRRHHHPAADDLYHLRVAPDLSVGEPTRVNHERSEVWGLNVSRPRVQVSGNGTVHVMYPANAERNGDPLLLARYARAPDGERFERPITLNSPSDHDMRGITGGVTATAHVFGTIGASPNGNVHAYWIDTRGMTDDGASAALWGAMSTDDGRSFSEDFAVLETGVCPCCQATTAFADGGQTVYVGLREVTPEAFRDSVVTVSRDGGAQFAPPVRLNEARWELHGCPLKPTALATAGDHVYTAWYSAAEAPPGAYFTASHDRGKQWTPPRALHPEATLSDAPVVAAGGDTLYVAWHARTPDGDARAVYLRYSRDGGRTLSDLIEVPVAGSGSASFPVAVADSHGRLYLAWQQAGRAWLTRVEPHAQ
ncbi:MAG: exo-alpha-sialidase [Gammaproteobacteria bacterium]|nr:exo-alpha-sialidase [Gammaproteobacteria bacterium]